LWGDSGFLIQTKRAHETNGPSIAGMALIVKLAPNAIVLEQRDGRFETAPRQRDVARKILGAADNAGLVPHGKAHRLNTSEQTPTASRAAGSVTPPNPAYILLHLLCAAREGTLP